ncbi:hypothetical protein TM102_25330 [Bradyrhizobium sp. TM102]|nr:hypothetical protein TM102_25330 [Bradyrhizobium sp. TM102]
MAVVPMPVAPNDRIRSAVIGVGGARDAAIAIAAGNRRCEPPPECPTGNKWNIHALAGGIHLDAGSLEETIDEDYFCRSSDHQHSDQRRCVGAIHPAC